jgi:hypothetical protein
MSKQLFLDAGLPYYEVGGVMPEAKLKKALITSRYPTTRELAKRLHVPMARVEKLVEELRQIQKHNAQTVPGYPQSVNSAPKSEKSGTARAATKRVGRAR